MTSFGLLLSVIGAGLVGWFSPRPWRNKDGELEFAGEFGKRPMWTTAGWVLILTGFALQFIDSVRPG